MKITKRDTTALFLIAAVVLAAHAKRGLGFYLDDWTFLEKAQAATGWWDAARGFFLGGHARRPLQALIMPFTYLTLQATPGYGHGLLLALGALEGFLFYRFTQRITRDYVLALIAALLVVVYPMRPGTHYWLSNASQLLVHCLALGSFLLYGGAMRLVPALAGLGLYAAGLLTYESVAFLPLLFGAGVAFESYTGAPPEERDTAHAVNTAFEVLCNLFPYLLAFACCYAWIFYGSPRFGSAPNMPNFSLAHCLDVFAGGLYQATIFPFVYAAGKPSLLAAIFGVLLVPAFLLHDRGYERRPCPYYLPWMGLAVWIAGYLPFAISGGYTPTPFGVMSRTNGLGAWAWALLLTGGLNVVKNHRTLPRAKETAYVLAAVAIAFFISADRREVRRWAEAWRQQQALLDRVEPGGRLLPAGSNLILTNSNLSVAGAPVFYAHYDFGCALRVRTGRRDLQGDVLMPGFQFEENRIAHYDGSGLLRDYPYLSTYVYSDSNHAFAQILRREIVKNATMVQLKEVTLK